MADAWTTMLTAVSFVVMAGNKALFLRNMPTDVVREAKAAAARRGKTLTAIVTEALSRSLRVDGNAEVGADPLARDIAWYRANRTKLLRSYPGQYVAIVDGSVVDHGRNFDALATRVFARFGDRSVYMPRVQREEPTARIRSPRRSTT